ncbi:molybdopterin-dependent oxidoreductase [Luteolibacter sp. SL250]|uniref:molybdopterin-dependent oxidoreductase n=1 Tax=Luteolibacter sp. SL250 TaxID=2995170 RepID=UPI00226E1526|nr:molybdopterin-dependent oxidoreductase [Luteolibacter sp. SL250]WAC17971.1 molybdopterin-dependent oxidoreductase [Luteolibacter sp. SL250]
MKSSILLPAFFCLTSLLLAEPVFRIHDGKEWRDFDASSWEKLPRAEIKSMARDNTERTYSGVPLAEILKAVPVPAGPTLRGPEMERVVVITAADGYKVSFSLAELDASFRKQNVILADRVDGKPLSDHEGKRMLVCGDDLRHSRWIRQITGVVVTRPVMPE